METIGQVSIKGHQLYFYVDFMWVGARRQVSGAEMGITLSDIVEGGITRGLTEKIAKKNQVFLGIRDFGGSSSGDPPRYEKVFSVILKRQYTDYASEHKLEEIENEMKRAKEHLVSAVEELVTAIDKAANFLMKNL